MKKKIALVVMAWANSLGRARGRAGQKLSVSSRDNTQSQAVQPGGQQRETRPPPPASA